MLQQTKWLDLTHVLNEKTLAWEGAQCAFKLHTKVDYKDCTGSTKFRVQGLEMKEVGIGTHIDAPAHCVQNGREIHELLLHELICDCVVIRTKKRGVAETVFSKKDVLQFEQAHGAIKPNSFVCFDSGWASNWENSDQYRNDYIFPTVDAEVAEYLLTKKISGIGIDTLSPDNPKHGFPVHELILGADKYIIENINRADQLPVKGAVIFALPMLIEHAVEVPLRLIAATPN